MANLLSRYTEIGFTILPHSLDIGLQQALVNYPGRNVIGYVKFNNETSEYKFINVDSTESNTHWALDILKKFPYYENTYTWIVFNCPPHKTKGAFKQVLFGEEIQIAQWDAWSVEGANAKVAVITSWTFA